jgi:hypothetical protein
LPTPAAFADGAERVPEIADELLPMARQLDTEADDLTADPGPPAAA